MIFFYLAHSKAPSNETSSRRNTKLREVKYRYEPSDIDLKTKRSNFLSLDQLYLPS